MKQILHVAQDAIRKNAKHGTNDPAIIIRDYKGGERAHEAAIMVGGVEVGRFVYRPHKPLGCGARLWLEVNTDIAQIIPVEKSDENDPALDDVAACSV